MMLASCPHFLPLFSINLFFAKVIPGNADKEIALDFFASSVVCHYRQPFIEHSVFRDIRNEVSRKTGLNNPEGIYFLIKENL